MVLPNETDYREKVIYSDYVALTRCISSATWLPLQRKCYWPVCHLAIIAPISEVDQL